MFSDEVTEDRSGWVNSEVYTDILAQIHPNGAKLIWRRFIVQMDNYPNTYSKCNPGVFEGKKVEYSQSPCLNPISLVKDKTKGKKETNKQQLKSAAVKTWQCITKEETQSLVMSMSSRL